MVLEMEGSRACHADVQQSIRAECEPSEHEGIAIRKSSEQASLTGCRRE